MKFAIIRNTTMGGKAIIEGIAEVSEQVFLDWNTNQTYGINDPIPVKFEDGTFDRFVQPEGGCYVATQGKERSSGEYGT